jgi:hypothetical protein
MRYKVIQQPSGTLICDTESVRAAFKSTRELQLPKKHWFELSSYGTVDYIQRYKSGWKRVPTQADLLKARYIKQVNRAPVSAADMLAKLNKQYD